MLAAGSWLAFAAATATRNYLLISDDGKFDVQPP